MGSSDVLRSFTVPISAHKTVEIKITEPNLRADNLHLTTWPSSLIMASVLHTLAIDLNNLAEIEVLELGAGTGLVGLTACLLWQKQIILTDLPPILPGLEANININVAVLKESAGSIQCGSLDWSHPETLVLESGKSFTAAQTKASIILAADTVYSEEHPELLSRAILTWLAPGPNSRAIITCALRVAYLDFIRELWELLERGGLETIQDGQQKGIEEDWDDECLCEWSVWRWKQGD